MLNGFLHKIYNCHKLKLKQIKILVGAGANPRYNDDIFFVFSCQYDDIRSVIYFLDECGANINAQNSGALCNAIRYDQYEITKLLLDLEIEVTDKAISFSFTKDEIFSLDSEIEATDKIFSLIIGHVNLDRIANVFVRIVFTAGGGANRAKYLNYAKILIRTGVDINQYILNA